jgi:hypothetical protein
MREEIIITDEKVIKKLAKMASKERNAELQYKLWTYIGKLYPEVKIGKWQVSGNAWECRLTPKDDL